MQPEIESYHCSGRRRTPFRHCEWTLDHQILAGPVGPQLTTQHRGRSRRLAPLGDAVAGTWRVRRRRRWIEERQFGASTGLVGDDLVGKLARARTGR